MGLTEIQRLLAEYMISLEYTREFIGTLLTFLTDEVEVTAVMIYLLENDKATEREILRVVKEIKTR